MWLLVTEVVMGYFVENSMTKHNDKGGYFKDDRNFWAFFDPLPPPYCVQTVHT